MVSTLKVNTIQRQSGTTITIGESGDTITITSGATLSGSGASLTALDAGNISAGTLAIARGGTGSTSTTYCDLTANVTGTLPTGKGGTGSTSTTYASLTANVSGTLPVGNGGTNLTSYAVGDILYASGTTTLSKLAKPGTPADEVLTFATGASAPSWVESAGGISWQSVQTSTPFTAVAGNGYPINTTSGAITINLPAGVVGEQVAVVDYAGTFDTNALTISADGSEKIKGLTNDAVMQTERQAGTLTYVDATQGWIATASAPDPGMVSPAFVAATGPDSAAGTIDGDYKYHTFTASKTGSSAFVVSDAGGAIGSNTLEYLIIAGGGGGGGQARSGAYYGAGGGGAGGYRTAADMACPAIGNHDVTIGAGGAGGTNTVDQNADARGTQGSSSVFNSITSTGGGFGGDGNTNATNVGGSGGSGGGGGASSSGSLVGGSGTVGQGNDGGDAKTYGGGGGGGATGAGQDAQAGGNGGYSNGGYGGAGTASSITGASVTRAGGGGGGAYTGGNGGAAGSGGGSAGGNNTVFGAAGTVNTGGGSGGAGRDSGVGTNGSGGSGVVIIRYKFQ